MDAKLNTEKIIQASILHFSSISVFLTPVFCLRNVGRLEMKVHVEVNPGETTLRAISCTFYRGHSVMEMCFMAKSPIRDIEPIVLAVSTTIITNHFLLSNIIALGAESIAADLASGNNQLADTFLISFSSAGSERGSTYASLKSISFSLSVLGRNFAIFAFTEAVSCGKKIYEDFFVCVCVWKLMCLALLSFISISVHSDRFSVEIRLGPSRTVRNRFPQLITVGKRSKTVLFWFTSVSG